MKRRILAFMLAAVVAFPLVACGGSGDSSKSTGSDSAESEQESATDSGSSDETEEAETTASEDEGDLGDYHVKINDATFGQDYEGKNMIVIHYDFTNNSEDSASALWSLSIKAFQDGIELDTAIAMDDSQYDAGIAQKEIKSGVTVEDCQEAYVLTGDSPVEFEVSELVSFDDTKLTKTFEVTQ